MKYLITLLTLITIVGCKQKPEHILIPLSFHDKTEFTIIKWSVSNNGFEASGEEIGSDGYRRRGWGQTYHVFSCDWENDRGNILIEKVWYGTEEISEITWSGDTTSIWRMVPKRRTVITSSLGKHSIYRPIVEALAGEYPR